MSEGPTAPGAMLISKAYTATMMTSGARLLLRTMSGFIVLLQLESLWQSMGYGNTKDHIDA